MDNSRIQNTIIFVLAEFRVFLHCDSFDTKIKIIDLIYGSFMILLENDFTKHIVYSFADELFHK